MAKNDFSIKGELIADPSVATAALNKWLNDVESRTEAFSNQIQSLFKNKITQEIVQEITVDDSGVRRLEYKLKETGRITDQLTKNFNDLNKIQIGSVSSLRGQVNEAKQARDAIVKYGQSVDALGNKITSLNPRWELANQKVQQLSKQLDVAASSNFFDRIKAEFNLGPIIGAGRAINGLVNTFQSLSIVIAQINAPINALLNALNDLQQIELLFSGIGAGPAEVGKVFADSQAIALKYGVSLKTVREAFAQLTPVVLASGGSLSNVSEITSALSSRFVTFGLSAEKSRRVMNGVIQAFGKGKLMAEELTQQISEADPAFKTDLANAIGVTVARLNEMVKAGEVDTKMLLEKLPLLAKTSRFFEQLGTSATSATLALARGAATVEQVKNQLATLNQLNLEAFAKLFEPALAGFVLAQAAIVDFISSIKGLAIVQTIANFIASLTTQFGLLLAGLLNIGTVVLNAVDVIFAFVNAIDDAGQRLIGFRPIVGGIALVIGTVLVNSLINLANVITTRALTALGALNLGLVANARAFIASGAGAIKSFIVSLATIGPGATLAATGVNILNASLTALLARLALILAPLAVLGFVFGAIGPKPQAKQDIKDYQDQLKDLRGELTKLKVAQANATEDAVRFYNELARNTSKDFEPRGIATARVGFIDTGTKQYKQELQSLQKVVDVTAESIRKYNKEQDASGNKAEFIENDVKTQIKSFDALIQAMIKTRDAEMQMAAMGAGIGPEEAESLHKLQRQIEAVRKAREDFVKGAKEKGFAIEVDVKGTDKSVLSIQGIKDELKELEGKQATILFGTEKYDEVTNKVIALKGLAEALEANPIELQFKIEFDSAVAKLKNLGDIAGAGLDNVKARVGLEQSIFDVYKGRANFQTAEAEKELESLRARGASAETIRAKENEIAGLKETERNLEKTAIQNRIDTLDDVQEKEREVLRIKQEQEKLQARMDEAKAKIEGAKSLGAVAEASRTVVETRDRTKYTDEDRAAAQAAYQAAVQYNKAAQEGVAIAGERVRALQTIQGLEVDTLRINQQAERNQLGAQAAAYGMADGLAQSRTAITGVIQAGGQLVTITNQVPVSINDAITALRTAGDGAGELTDEMRNAYTEAGNTLIPINNLTESLRTASQAASNLGPGEGFSDELYKAQENIDDITGADLPGEIGNAKRETDNFVNSLGNGATEAQSIVDRLQGLDGSSIDVNVNLTGTQGLWTGGPTEAGTTYRVNELGREAFLSAGGTLSMINRPKNALWRAPSSGTVIPAHIASSLNIPGNGVKVSGAATANVARTMSNSSGSKMNIAKAITAALQSVNGNNDVDQLAMVQANQAMQIGKLSRAVSDLASKDWNVNVDVRNTGHAAYLQALNHKL